MSNRKSEGMEAFLEAAFGRTTHMKVGLCVMCSNNVGDFTDALSAREYEISGMCQACQDGVFGAPE